MKKEDDKDKKVTSIKKGKKEKVTPLFDRRWQDDPDIAKYKEEIEKVSFIKAMNVCWVSKDEKGHSATLSFKVPPGLVRYFHVMMSASPKFKTMSDFLRTAIVLGARQMRDELEYNNKTLNIIDNFFRHLQLQNMILEDEIISSEASGFISRVEKVFRDCSSKTEFDKKYQKFREQAEGCGDDYLQERMFKVLELVKNLKPT